MFAYMALYVRIDGSMRVGGVGDVGRDLIQLLLSHASHGDHTRRPDPPVWGVGCRAEDAQGTPTQSHISPSIRAYEDKGPDETPVLLVLVANRRHPDKSGHVLGRPGLQVRGRVEVRRLV